MGVLCEPTPARPTPARPKPKVDGRRGPKRPLQRDADGSYRRPAGRQPVGKWWHSKRGKWVDDGRSGDTEDEDADPLTVYQGAESSPEPVESPAYAYPFPPRMIDQAFMKKEQAVRGELLGALAELCPPQHPLFLQHSFAHEEPALDHVAVSDDASGGRSSLSSDGFDGDDGEFGDLVEPPTLASIYGSDNPNNWPWDWFLGADGAAGSVYGGGAAPTPAGFSDAAAAAADAPAAAAGPSPPLPAHRDDCSGAAASSSSSSSERRPSFDDFSFPALQAGAPAAEEW